MVRRAVPVSYRLYSDPSLKDATTSFNVTAYVCVA